MQKLTKLISVIFHPVLIPIIGMFLIFHSGTLFSFIPSQVKNFSYIVVFLSTFLLPISILPLLKFQRLISSYALTDRKERIIPMILSIIFFFMGFYILRRIPMTAFLQSFFLSMMVIVSGVSLISFSWKISMHLSSIGALTALVVVLSMKYSADIFWVVILAVLLSGLMGYSRLYRGRHNQWQVYAGYFWGFTSAFLILWYI